MAESETSRRLIELLSSYLGPHNARVAVKTFCKKAGCTPENLGNEQVDSVLEALKPMMNTLLGKAAAAGALARIREELNK
ncbi:MAG: hypothetical protein D6806_00725 [Deltaproteobacteria bacterium]|nr:MAG: hypothetical protein D6806_00725 [Deltaproteobacteria bacterium]